MSLLEHLKNFKEDIKFYVTSYNRNVVIVALLSIFSLGGVVFLGLAKAKRENVRRVHFLSLLKEYQEGPSSEGLNALVDKARHSSFLQKQYGHALIQEQIFIGHEKLSKRLKLPLSSKKFSNDDYYARFAKTTFEISEGRYAIALEQAQALEKDLVESGLGENPLQGANSVRIACLYQKLGDKKQELAQLDKIVASGATLDLLKNTIFEEALTIQDYIAYRQRVLKTSE